MMSASQRLSPADSYRTKTQAPATAVPAIFSTPPATAVPAIFSINQLKRKFDSVDNIMDRIDAGISTLRKIEVRDKDESWIQKCFHF